MLTEIGLGIAVVCAGLWSGLLLTLTTILHPMYAARDGCGLASDLRRFLPIARRSPTNYVLIVGLVVGPAMALVGLRGDPTGAPFVLTAIGFALTISGPVLISRYAVEPNYDVIIGWNPAAVPDDWQTVRARYFALNWIRGGLNWTAFALFLAATHAHLT